MNILRRACVPSSPWRIALAAWAALSLPALAQEGGPPAEPGSSAKSGNQLDRVVVTGRSGDNDLRRRASVAKQIYGREEIDRHGDSNLADVLKRLPGIEASGSSVKMRGLGSGYTQILLNGDPAPPGFQLDQLDPSLVDRIEVTKGASAEHSAQAVAGTINILLKNPPRISSRELQAGLGAMHRPAGRATFTLNESLGAWSLTAPLGLFTWDGRNLAELAQHSTGTDGLPADLELRSRTEFWGQGFHFMPRAQWKVSEEANLALNAFAQKGWWHNRERHGVTASQGRPRIPDDAFNQGSWEHLRLGAHYTHQYHEDAKLELKLGRNHQGNRHDNTTEPAAPPALRSQGETREESWTQSGKHVLALGEDHTLVAGWDWESRQRHEERSLRLGPTLLLADFNRPFEARIQRGAVFVQDEWNAGAQWGLSLGLRGERIATRSEATDGSPIANTATVWTPLLHATYKLDPKARDQLRMSLTRSYKAPKVEELMGRPSIHSLALDTRQPNTVLSADASGNPALRPELATGIDLAFEHYLPGGGLVSVGGFHRQVKDLIRSRTELRSVAWATVPRWVSMPVNIGQATTSGLEFELKGRLAEFLPQWVDAKTPTNVRASLNLYRSRVEGVPGPDNRLDGQQPWSLSLGGDHRFSLPPMMLVLGGSFTYTPAYRHRSTNQLTTWHSAKRGLDVYAMLPLSKTTMVRAMVSNALAPDVVTRAHYDDTGDRSERRVSGHRWGGVMLTMKF